MSKFDAFIAGIIVGSIMVWLFYLAIMGAMSLLEAKR